MSIDITNYLENYTALNVIKHNQYNNPFNYQIILNDSSYLMITISYQKISVIIIGYNTTIDMFKNGVIIKQHYFYNEGTCIDTFYISKLQKYLVKYNEYFHPTEYILK
jgi:hypothetical protein